MQIKRFPDRTDRRAEGRRDKAILIYHQPRLWRASNMSREGTKGIRNRSFARVWSFCPIIFTNTDDYWYRKVSRENTVSNKRISRMRRKTHTHTTTPDLWHGDRDLTSCWLFIFSFFFSKYPLHQLVSIQCFYVFICVLHGPQFWWGLFVLRFITEGSTRLKTNKKYIWCDAYIYTFIRMWICALLC